MTEHRGSEEELLTARIIVALSNLEDIRTRLTTAGDSQRDTDALTAALLDFWRNQEPLLKDVGRSLLEILRRQALEQLYEWREQIQEVRLQG
ncbi:hypothetical protein ACQPXM_05985 [Kribbella sp. CA-253562]|uniref:hypothetical protein n=1 Tax=Kribbella sp. CA-253562 TaxID=3239942 RepID=UPI003D8F40EA